MPLEPVKTRDKANFKLSDGFEVTLRRFVGATGATGCSVLVSGAVVDKTDGAAVQSFSSEDIFAQLTEPQQNGLKTLLGIAEAKVKALLGV